ncbi:helix-turn-helix transcriptional regulator [Halomonas salipaludis]|uniref:AraC family transcriptional regulator n=1 Tax=Halomonas salipaludis TaxID=2032625 RepID=A0A2A2ET91_9GAMM|nr:AraC family transcriptional regulator [Halomonas salipaludis]PAU75557.1 AraC family transcriptional regulator [Halomonas salipaludis]
MTTTANLIATGPGWEMQKLICTAGPQDRPFEERHGSVIIAGVMSGTFLYRTETGKALLPPGGLLLGNVGQCFCCSHEHGAGDRCISIRLTPEYWENLVAEVPGMRSTTFDRPMLSPSPALAPVTAALASAAVLEKPALVELVPLWAETVMQLAHDERPGRGSASPRHERRVTEAVRHIERSIHEAQKDDLSLDALADSAHMSRYHFLRTFLSVIGMTPYQYVLHLRMKRAAHWLLITDEPISTIAFDAGFNDLSTFHHRFRRIMGKSPGTYRRQRSCQSSGQPLAVHDLVP